MVPDTFSLLSMYSLLVLFFSLPLYFSHIFSPVGIIIGDSSSFERQKVYLLGILLLCSLVEVLMTRGEKLQKVMVQYWGRVMGLLILPFLSAWWGTGLNERFLIGSFEKHHGYIWFVYLVIVGLLLQVFSSVEKARILRVSLISGVIVSIFAVVEFLMGGSPFFHGGMGASWGELRSMSTLGNPNYVAGYLLILLPFVTTLRVPERWIYSVIVTLALFSTGSYIGIVCSLAYFIYRGIRSFQSKKQSLVVIGGLFCLICIVGYQLIPHEKFLSLESRFVLMRELWTVMVQYPLSFMIGFGPESIISYFDGIRSALVNSYFPAQSAIDSSHNILLDAVFQYGIVNVILCIYFFLRNWKNLSERSQEGILLGLIFLSLNVVVTVHILLLLLLSSLEKQQKI